MKHYNRERGHLRLGYRSLIGYLESEVFILKTLAETGVEGGFAPGGAGG